MSRIEKRIRKWRNPSFRQDVPLEDIFTVLNTFFPDSYEFGGKRGSHIITVWHDCLKGESNFGIDGDFTIPTTGGKKIKHFYLKKLIEAIDIIKECEK